MDNPTKGRESADGMLHSGPVRQALSVEIAIISDRCIACKLCQKECALLRKYGKPKAIADRYDPDNPEHQTIPFACSLCRLCTAVCPVKIDPAAMFLEMRREAVDRGRGNFNEHKPLKRYERIGTSRLFTWYGLPAGCDTVFFPGCALSGSRPDRVQKLFRNLQDNIPGIGIVLDCCTKPSHDLGQEQHFHILFNEMKDYLVAQGIKRVLVSCPSCMAVFEKYGGGLSIASVYDLLAAETLTAKATGTVVIQDSCVARNNDQLQKSVRRLATKLGLTVEEMRHTGQKTLCCGEGGAAFFLAPEHAGNWLKMRGNEVNGRQIITYCAGCAHFLGRVAPTHHILDFLYAPDQAMSGKAKTAKSPFTYINRLLLKRTFKKHLHPAISAERPLFSSPAAP